MNTKEKLHIILKLSGLNQSELAARLGVTFAALNRWINEKAVPRKGALLQIDELYKEYSGEKIIPEDALQAKKQLLLKKSKNYPSVAREILEHPDIRDQFMLKLTYNSNSMEGSSLSEPDTAAILFDNVALPNKSLTEQLEAKNHQTALQYLFDDVAKNGPLDEDLILKLHGILLSGVHPDAGFYRRHGVRITGVNLATANFLKIPDLMPALIKEMKKPYKDVIALGASFHARFEQIHPFPDGNGRVGRLLMNAQLLKANLPPAVIKQERKRLYNAYLYKAQTKEDQSQLEDFLCDAVLEGFDILERKV